MAIRRRSSVAATLTGGDLSVDVLHTEDSVRLGDGTNLMGAMSLVGAVRAIPVDVLQTVGVLPANLTSGTQRSKLTDGTDNVEIQTVGAEKALKVSVIATVGGGSGGTAATDSAAYTATATQFTPTGGAFDDVASDALAEGEMGIVRLTSARAMHVSIQNASVAVTGTFWQATQPVSGTFYQATQPVSIASMPSTPVTGTFWQATQPISGTVTINAIPAGTNNIGDVDVLSLPAIPAGTNNIGDVDILSIAAGDNNIGNVDVLTMPTVAVTGTFWQATQPISGTVTINAIPAGANNIGDVDVLTLPDCVSVGKAAHDAAVSGNPVRVAGKAMMTNAFTAVASGDVCDISTDNQGRQIITPHAPRDFIGHQTTTITASITETTIFTAGAAGVFLDLTQITITNSSATALIVTLKDATAGTTRAIYAIAANGGIVITPIVPINQAAAAANWTLTCGTSVSSIYVYVQAVRRLA